MNYQIKSDWTGSTGEYLQLKKGEIVELGKTSEDYIWKNWRECFTSNLGGWVPIQIIKIISDKSGEIIEDYSAFELNTNSGESFICEKELNGWLYGFIDMKESIKGWIPKETVEIKDNMITKIETSDVSELLDFIVKYKTETKRNITPGIIANIQKEINEVINSNTSFAFKCIDDNRVLCGYMIFHLLNFPMINGKEAYITELFIDSKERGKGLGRKFLSIAENIARENKCSRLMLNNPKEYESYERSFYSKNGYIERDNFANFVKDLSE